MVSSLFLIGFCKILSLILKLPYVYGFLAYK